MYMSTLREEINHTTVTQEFVIIYVRMIFAARIYNAAHTKIAFSDQYYYILFETHIDTINRYCKID